MALPKIKRPRKPVEETQGGIKVTRSSQPTPRKRRIASEDSYVRHPRVTDPTLKEYNKERRRIEAFIKRATENGWVIDSRFTDLTKKVTYATKDDVERLRHYRRDNLWELIDRNQIEQKYNELYDSIDSTLYSLSKSGYSYDEPNLPKRTDSPTFKDYLHLTRVIGKQPFQELDILAGIAELTTQINAELIDPVTEEVYNYSPSATPIEPIMDELYSQAVDDFIRTIGYYHSEYAKWAIDAVNYTVGVAKDKSAVGGVIIELSHNLNQDVIHDIAYESFMNSDFITSLYEAFSILSFSTWGEDINDIDYGYRGVTVVKDEEIREYEENYAPPSDSYLTLTPPPENDGLYPEDNLLYRENE